MAPIRLAIAGVGKIARDQHLPAIAANNDFQLVAAVSRNASVDGVANFRSFEELRDNGPEFDAISLCMPPSARFAMANAALQNGKHVMLEKPPGATTSEIDGLLRLAENQQLSLFATWHSRYAPAVAPTKALLADAAISKVRIVWKEDVWHWHPGQEWIWEAGGFGVFDPFINALSIVTEILPEPFYLTGSDVLYPANKQAPIAAELTFTDANKLDMSASIDWRQKGPQSWDILVSTDKGDVALTLGGSKLELGGQVFSQAQEEEYPELYRRFSRLVGQREIDVDIRPLKLVADAFLIGGRRETEPFRWD